MRLATGLVRTTVVTAAFVLLALPAQGATIEIWQGAGALTSIGAADTLIASGAPTFSVNHVGPIDFDDLGDGTTGLSPANNPWPGGANTTFAARITGGITLAAAQAWGFAINHDDGVRLRVNGVDVILYSGETDNIFSFGGAVLNAGLNILEIVFFENQGGASLEFYAAQGSLTTPTLQELAGLQTVPEPATMLLVGAGLVGAAARRRLKNRA